MLDDGAGEEERQLREAIALYTALTGKRPAGWNCRSFPSVNTRDLLVEEGGFLYHSDPCNDDLPYFLDHRGTEILVVPYSKTLNDSRYLVAPGYSNPRDFAEDCRSAIDYMLDEADETGGRMLTIGIHARWMGQPNRASGLREVIEHVKSQPGAAFMRREDIARFWLDNRARFERSRADMFDTLISGATVINADGPVRADVAIAPARWQPLWRPASRRRPAASSKPMAASCCRAWSTRMRICASPD